MNVPICPSSEKIAFSETLHGVELQDSYQWLEDQKSPKTRDWIHHQNQYTQQILNQFSFRNAIQEKVAELVHIDVIQRPEVRNHRYFFMKRLAEQDLPLLYYRNGPKGVDHILIDPHTLSPEHLITATIQDISTNGNLLAYGLCEGGEDEIVVQFLQVEPKKNLPDVLPKGRYFGISLTPDQSGVFYTFYNEKGSRVRYHRFGTETSQDIEIFGQEYGPEKIIFATLSENGNHLLIHVLYGSSSTQTDVYYKNLEKNTPVVPLIQKVPSFFMGNFAGETIFFETNWNAPRKRILAVSLQNLQQPLEEWKEIVPEQPSILHEFVVAGDKLVINYLENVTSLLKIFETTGTLFQEVRFPVLGSVSELNGHWGDLEFFFTFSSFHIPTTIYSYHLETKKQEIWAQVSIPVPSERFELKQVWYPSKDGTLIPMFLLHQKGLILDGSHPTMLSGYGGFNVCRTPTYNALSILWVEHGGVYAVPSLRGGGEFGEEWHQAGMREKKQNVFDDFIAAGEWLIQSKYTISEKLCAVGGSNGGLLVGAMMTQRPELFRAIICFYPLLDMIRYHKFLVARFWVPEYGSAEDPEQFQYLLKYSPYHQVKPHQVYPAVLFVTGDADTRVDPLHARKMTALLQESASAERPVMLYYDTQLGHAGGQPASKQIEDTTQWLSFLFWQLDALD